MSEPQPFAVDTALEIISEHHCFGGIQGYYRHRSSACNAPMKFGVFLPPSFAQGSPGLMFLAGLECNEQTFAMKAGAQRFAAQFGLVLITPDTSPRDTGTPGESDSWDFGVGAGFYVDATEAPWSRHWRMETYIVDELPRLVSHYFGVDLERLGIFGHSMGGHGALTLALKHPERFRSLSAFAPIASPSRVPWGDKAFSHYLGADRDTWRAHDAVELIGRKRLFPATIRVDQGLADRFLDTQLKTDWLEAACTAAGQPLDLRRHEGYDHGYYFIQSFIEPHLRHHASALMR